ncbi:carboxy-S-adenosyl-L-methionine synthase CmoA [Sulfurimonas sp. HSL-1716]|uniref:carboxy-S-adenosyl-L-methionine synthase CmoA n=1 Tax=Hydrocurvibacter sulfurireducens TaxID=3131937 RepID=UPI0031F93195
MKKDKVFTKPIEKQFEFDEDVAAVFDDMLSRSVPFYKESQEITKHFTSRHLKNGSIVYDLGCSTASTLLSIERDLSKERVRLIGIDNSKAMLEQAKKKIDAFDSDIEVLEGDILEFDYQKADVFISNYTLQFVRPLVREKLIRKICGSLNENGVFIFSEKIISEHKLLNKELIDYYYDFKKEQGYSQYEIMQKREALENVLIPYSESENIKMAKECGFSHCEAVFRWGNFATFIAIK